MRRMPAKGLSSSSSPSWASLMPRCGSSSTGSAACPTSISCKTTSCAAMPCSAGASDVTAWCSGRGAPRPCPCSPAKVTGSVWPWPAWAQRTPSTSPFARRAASSSHNTGPSSRAHPGETSPSTSPAALARPCSSSCAAQRVAQMTHHSGRPCWSAGRCTSLPGRTSTPTCCSTWRTPCAEIGCRPTGTSASPTRPWPPSPQMARSSRMPWPRPAGPGPRSARSSPR